MRLYTITLLAFIVSLNACAQSSDTKKGETKQMNDDYMKLFINNFEDFEMDIQGAGIATIPKAIFSKNGELYIEYAYTSGGEKRNGKMTLTEKFKNRLEGSWRTIADNGNVYQGTLFFEFKKNGEADGYYKFAGGDYAIAIETKK